MKYDWVSRAVNKTMKKLIVFGSDEDNIKAIQSTLVVTESFCGPKTYKAVLDYQKQNKLIVDGIVGPQTLKKMGIKQ
ncbi:MAG: peptidoglycan-binding domain-containing protein [Candidatus Cloacimonetes bacterium]|nr:peptidoglycan-binding domain-containing protein [Candidatus Cloacimonadota bacterium]